MQLEAAKYIQKFDLQNKEKLGKIECNDRYAGWYLGFLNYEFK